MSRRIWIIAGLVALLAVALWIGPRSCASAERSAAIAAAGQARAEGQTRAATDATAITATSMEAAAASDQLGRDTADVIRATPGAAAPIDPAVNAAALRRICLRAAYRDQPRCVALLGPRASTIDR
ncbi:hypothetical protein [Sphingomonas sp. KC8]|uniref:hypothetical protein n=1 Tax=Sphingomonas sp. KC8 TaxID=1030157 RepID=UPI00024897D2|nr:hypothetical protein [Sphingomonas sp. KC8]ARS29094.1 hypothetical protein KC8_17630 [Sphingomonas sp. KC8]